MVYRSCMKSREDVLDNGNGKDPMDAHDFGPAAMYLFKSCELDDALFEEMEAQAS
jgi:hypothetical protein